MLLVHCFTCSVGGEALHVDLKMFSCHDYRLAWFLVVPAWNWIKGTFARLRSAASGANGDLEEEVVEEEEVEAEEDDDGVAYA
jgi:hypothetical protein